ncbi:MAG TPA: hypothetical protein VGP87_13880 [Gemmatimonadales bacterium]|nr:hypothetical protein [Gemmatimonadales bacterium]
MADLPDKRIDRAALERIMQRAAELQAGEADVGDGLSPDEVVALGKEVGIPGRYLQQAMLEQATEIVAPASAGVLGHVVGPTEVSAYRVVLGDPDDAARALIDWFDRNELLVVQRQTTGRVSFEPLGGMQAALRRGGAVFGATKPKFMLARATLVTATFSKLESGYCHVGLTANIKQARTGYIAGAVAGSSVGVSAAVVASMLSPFWLVALPPLLVGGALSWFVLKQFKPVAERCILGLERALDYLERGGIKPAHELPPRGSGLLETIAGEIRKAIIAAPERPKSK